MTLTEYKSEQVRSKSRHSTQSHWKPRYVALVTDILAISAAIATSTIIESFYAAPEPIRNINSRQLLLTVAVGASWIIAIWLRDGYGFSARLQSTTGIKIMLASSLFVAGGFAIAGAISNLELINPYLLLSFPIGMGIMSGTRFIIAANLRRKKRQHPSQILFVGCAQDILDILGSDFAQRFPYHRIAAFSLMDPENQQLLPQLPDSHVVPYTTDVHIADLAKQYHCNTVWVASVTQFGHKNLRRLAWDLRHSNTNLYVEPMIEDVADTRLHPVHVGPRTVLSIAHPRIRAANGWLKRAFDIAFSLTVLILVSPIMIITALAIKLEDGGPILYKSERIGRKGKPYPIWKFRSMCVHAEDKVQELISQTGGNSLLFKMKDDPRVTRVGRFIRKYSIDELPQLLNALNGTMSIVGPRPQVQREVDEYDADMFMRLEVPPGITGLWQVSGRSNLSPQLAQALDLYYVDNWSFRLDLRILFATIKAVLKPEGAY